MTHCEDIAQDRQKGHLAEICFCELLIRNQRQITGTHKDVVEHLGLSCEVMPDWSPADVSWKNENSKHYLAEVKSKSPTSYGEYGLEEYRLRRFIHEMRKYDIGLYVILNSGTWWGADFNKLIEHGGRKDKFPSWRGGQKSMFTDGRYWPENLWKFMAADSSAPKEAA